MMDMATRIFSGKKFRCAEPGLWIADDRTVLREEFRGMPNHHGWVAERWGSTDREVEEHYGIGLTLKEAADTLRRIERKIEEKPKVVKF